MALRKVSLGDEAKLGLKRYESSSGELQLRLERVLCREDDSISIFDESDGEDGILWNDFGESQLGSISAHIKPLHMFVFANVVLALKAAPERHEKERLVLRSLNPDKVSIPTEPLSTPSFPLHLYPKLTFISSSADDMLSLNMIAGLCA